MLEVKNLTIKTLENRELIKDLSFTLNQGNRLAIIGEEGNGKSTLLKCIYDKQQVTSYAKVTGNIIKNGLQLGYLEQFLDTDWNTVTVEQYFLKSSPKEEIDYEKYAMLYQVEQLFKHMQLNNDYLQQEKTIQTLSGGEKVKLQLVKVVMNKPDILVLDEPTNDLDIITLEWLENFLLTLTIPVIFVSHDEVLLKRVANGILHLEQIENKTKARYTYEQIGYQEYIEKRAYLLRKTRTISQWRKKRISETIRKISKNVSTSTK